MKRATTFLFSTAMLGVAFAAQADKYLYVAPPDLVKKSCHNKTDMVLLESKTDEGIKFLRCRNEEIGEYTLDTACESIEEALDIFEAMGKQGRTSNLGESAKQFFEEFQKAHTLYCIPSLS